LTTIGTFTYRGVEYTVRLKDHNGSVVKSFRPSDGRALSPASRIPGVIGAYKRWLKKFEAQGSRHRI
jgi:hypothetical protein